MKLLINGNSVSEIIKNKYSNNDTTLACKVLDHIKNNKYMYARLVVVTAIMLHLNMNFIFSDSVDVALDATFGQLIDLLNKFAKWGCLGMGIKRLIEEMLSGGNFKQASMAGIQYWLCFLFIQFYPRLFDMIKF